jgi:hypothetical protein
MLVLEEALHPCSRVPRQRPISDVIEKPLSQPFSRPLCVVAEAQAESAGGHALFFSSVPTNQTKGWGT